MKKLEFKTVEGWKSYSYIEFDNFESNTTIIKITGIKTIKRIFKSRHQTAENNELWDVEDDIEIIDLNKGEKLIFNNDRLNKINY